MFNKGWNIFDSDMIETIAVVVLGIILMLVIEPITPMRQVLAAILAALVLGMLGISLWHRAHDGQSGHKQGRTH